MEGSNFLAAPVSSMYPASFRDAAGLSGSGAAFQTNLLMDGLSMTVL